MSSGSRMLPDETQDLSSGPYPSQFTKYCRPLPLRRTANSFLTEYTGPPSMNWGVGGGLESGTRGLSLTGLILLTWKVGCIRIDLGRRNLTATGLMTFDTGNGPTKQGVNLRETPRRAKSWVDSHTLWPQW